MDLKDSLESIGVVQRGDVRLRAGGTSGIYFDIKKAYGYPDILNLIADEIFSLFPENITVVAASGHGGIPLAALISSRHDLKLVMVRDSKKVHGLLKMVDGAILNENDRIAIVDDVFTSGSSLRQTMTALKDLRITGCFVVVKRGDGHLDCPLYHLFERCDFND